MLSFIILAPCSLFSRKQSYLFERSLSNGELIEGHLSNRETNNLRFDLGCHRVLRCSLVRHDDKNS